MPKLQSLVAIVALAVAAVPALADLTASPTADTWVEAHLPRYNFNSGLQGSAFIDGNDPGGQLRWVVEDGNFFARASIFQFELPVLPADEAVTGVRLTLWDGEGSEDPNFDALIGWLTGDVPMMRKITYVDLAPPGFSGNDNDFAAIDQSTQRINFDPAKVQFASNADSTEDLMAITLPGSLSNRPDQHTPYEDLTVADGVAQYIASQIDTATPQRIHLILSPTGSTNALALFHGIDSSTPTSDIFRDILGEPGNPDFFPKLEILTSASAPVPEPATALWLAGAVGGLFLARRPVWAIARRAGRTAMIFVASGVALLMLLNASARADLDTLLIGETFVDTAFSDHNFLGGAQGAGRIPGHPRFDTNVFTKGRQLGNGSTIPGNEVGGMLHWEIVTDVLEPGPGEEEETRCRDVILVSPCGFARATVLKFELPALPAGQTVTGVRLSLFDTEELSDQALSADVGWITVDVPILPFLSFEDLAEAGFSSNFNGGTGAMDQSDQTIKFDPAKVQFAPLSERMNLQIAGGTTQPDAYLVYEDNTVGDGLAQFVADTIDPNQATTIHVVLSPQGDTEFMALIHGTDPATVRAESTLAGDANNDGLVTGADLIAVQQNFGAVEVLDPPDAEPSGLLSGDANDDGLVTGADLISVQQNFGNAAVQLLEVAGNPADPQFEPVLQILTQPASAPLPEPASTVLAAAGILLGTRRDPRG